MYDRRVLMNINAGSPEKIDADILQCRIDILRARDGGGAVKTPPPSEAAETTLPKDRNPEPVKAGESKSEKSSENSPVAATEPIPCEVVEPASESSEEPAAIVETKPAEEKDKAEIKAIPHGDVKLKSEIQKLKAEIKKMVPQDDDGEIMEAANSPAEQIPQLNLAEQILVEQRKVASLRRKKPDSKASPGKLSPVTGTMAEIINESKSKTRPAEQIASVQSPCVHSLVTGSDKLGRGQQQIITNIVSADIAALCKMKASEGKARQNFSNN